MAPCARQAYMRGMSLSLTRRSAIGLLGAVAAPAVLRADQLFDADVLVVGAGVAGLAAARALRAAGRSTIVVEARDRIGGRVLTVRDTGALYEAGAMYIHWAEHNPLAKLAQDAGLATVSDRLSGARIRSFDRGVETPLAARAARMAAFGRLNALLDGDDVADVAVAALAHDAALDEAAAGLSRFSLGDEPQTISARDYARLWSGDDLLLPDGYGALTDGLARDVPVRLSTPVSAIDWSGAGVVAQTDAGVIRARRAIVTVPVGVLRTGAIRFRPELPATTQDAIAGMQMGALSKIGMRFDFSKFDLPRGDIFTRDPESAFDFDCRPFDRDIVVAIFGGDFARTITQSPQEAVDATLNAFVEVVGGDVRGAFRMARLHAWHNEPFSLGCYSHCLPGHADARAALGAPVGDRIVFAGEASAPEGAAMTTGGAFLAGQAAAKWATN